MRRCIDVFIRVLLRKILEQVDKLDTSINLCEIEFLQFFIVV